MASYREYLIDQKTNWQAVQNEISKSLAGVKNPVNPNVQVPTLAQLSGNPAAGGQGPRPGPDAVRGRRRAGAAYR